VLKKIIRSPGFNGAAMLFASVLSISFALWLVYPRPAATAHLASGATKNVDIPWTFWEVSKGNQLSVHLPVRLGTPRRFNIAPDDHLAALSINGQPVALSGIPEERLNDWQNGFDIDLSSWLHYGDNTLEFIVDNGDGPGGINLRPLVGWQRLLLATGLLPWLMLLGRWFKLSRPQLLILSGALLVLCCYWAATPWTVRNYDVLNQDESGHFGYIRYILSNLALPRPDQGWEYYQTPLYYIAGALVSRWAQLLGITEPEALQAFALSLWLVFLAASAGTLRLTLRRSPLIVGLATAALATWPSGVIHSIRIGNELALYASAAVATWFMFRWWRGKRRRHLLAMALWVAVALLCKATAGLLFVAALVLITLHVVRSGWRGRALADAGIAGAVLATGMLLSFARGFYYWWHKQIPDILIGNIGQLAREASLHAANGFKAYIPLDLPVFLTTPWIDSRDDATGRNNHWNYFLRSSLSGEFHFDGTVHRLIALAWGGILIALLFSMAIRLSTLRWSLRPLWRDLPWQVLALLWLMSSLAVRIRYPFSPCSDFRFVVPILVPFLFVAARGRWVSHYLLLGMTATSALFFISL
jgi:hypothetical protein